MLQPKAEGVALGPAGRVFAGCWALLNFAIAGYFAWELFFGKGLGCLQVFLASGLGVLVTVTLLLNRGRRLHRWLPEMTAAAFLITVLVFLGLEVGVSGFEVPDDLVGQVSWTELYFVKACDIAGLFISDGYNLIPAAFALPTTVLAARISRLRPQGGGWVVCGIIAWLLVVLADLVVILELLGAVMFIVVFVLLGRPFPMWG
jgi:uncharacterized membrane protein YjjP (DUF1212 family)